MDAKLTIWTVGHSNRTLEEFLRILHVHQMRLVIDVRRFAHSRRFPHFNAKVLKKSLSHTNIGYLHYPALGGRRRPRAGSPNTGLENEHFRGFADHMKTDEFGNAIGELHSFAEVKRTVLMCAEAIWRNCHRSLIADYLTAQNWNVQHIESVTTTSPQELTPGARIVNGELTYEGEAKVPSKSPSAVGA